MNLGFGQVLVIIFFGLLLFCNLPKIFRELGNGINEFKLITRSKTSDIKDLKDIKNKK